MKGDAIEYVCLKGWPKKYFERNHLTKEKGGRSKNDRCSNIEELLAEYRLNYG